ncbi:YybH family protein [Daejeonella sp.]|jgi:ketosteroid isomerase-like protein|uniref:YybH family protein n=1 Tax=Daejeonella sp. TaxID=2805397 RepID=UPI003784E37D
MKLVNNSFVAMLIVFGLFTISCKNTNPESDNTFDLATAKQEIEAANKNLLSMLSKKDSVGIANEMYTSDAKFMDLNRPSSVGTAQIQSLFNEFITAGLMFELNTVEVIGNEELLVEEGTYDIIAADKKVDTGKYIAIWKKIDGKWKMYRDCPSSDLAVAK